MANANVCRCARLIGTAAIVLGLCWQQAVQAQIAAPAVPPRAASEAIPAPSTAPVAEPLPAATGATTREMVRRLFRAQELIAEESFAEGTRLLQTILDTEEDLFFHPDEENKTLERSLKSAALEQLGQLSFTGREAYERQYGPAARKMLDEALRAGDAVALGAVARRYFHTQAGYEAAYRLAADHLDHSRPLAAALCLERLRAARNARLQFDPMLSLTAAVSWQRAGMPAKSIEILTELKQQSRHPGITVGGREVPWFEKTSEATDWIVRLFGATGTPRHGGTDEWVMVGGNPTRNGESTGGSPYLNRSWRASTVEGVTTSTESDETVGRTLEERRQNTGRDSEDLITMIPSFQPLVVNDLVVVRSMGDVRAYSLSTGRLVWAAGEKDQSLADTMRANPAVAGQFGAGSMFLSLIAQRAWNDSTYGSLSSDGEFVFAVEDLGAITPTFQGVSRIQTGRDYNRLIALDARTGKAVWEVGGPKTEVPDELAGSFFLGPPLVLDQRLFCLAEAAGEVRLIVLDPRSGRLEWSQSLIDLALAGIDLSRRQSGLSPAFDGGIIVCPTGSGHVVAVDLTSRSLLWSYKFRNFAEGNDPRIQSTWLMQQQQNMSQRLHGSAGNDAHRWLDANAIISDARVLLTPRDVGEIHCLNLMDGSVLWKKPRGEGLYVAAVRQGRVIIVGKSYVQALRLADGEPAWNEPTAIPLPSGRGYGSGDTYHLPLSTAEVATIDLRDGRIIARSKSQEDRIPGNMVGVRGGIVSLGADFVEAFPQLDTLVAEISNALGKNPDDVDALALRGQMELQRGRLKEAYADLKRALDLKSDDHRVRELLLGSLLEGLRVDFAAYRGLQDEIDRLIADPSQRSTYLWIQANGLQRAGESSAAFETLLRFADPQVGDDELDRLDGAISVRRDRLVKSRIEDLYAAATSEERVQMDRAVERRVATLLPANDPAAATRFLSYFGRFAGSDPLRRQAAGASVFEGDWLAEEFRLQKLVASPEPQIAAPAALRLARLLAAAEKPGDALAVISRLGERWPDAPLVDGRTGAELAAEWLKKPAVQQLLSDREAWPTGLVEADRLQNVGISTGVKTYPIFITGDREPFFRDLLLDVNTRGQEFTARDPFGRALWKVSLESQSQYVSSVGNRAVVTDHFVVVSVGTQLVAIDPLGTADSPGARVLWRQPLTEVASASVVPMAAGIRRMRNPWSEFSGILGPVTRDYVCFQRGRKLFVVDPLTGRPVWTRDGIPTGGELLGDDELVISISPDDDATVFRALDGRELVSRRVPSGTSNFRREAFGRSLLLWGQVRDEQTLSRYDIWADRYVWIRRFAPKSHYRMVGVDEVAVLEPEGKFTIVGLADGDVRFQATADPEPNLAEIIVQRTPEQYLLIANVPLVLQGNARGGRIQSYSELVNGRLYGFERPTGRRLWSTSVERQWMDPYDSPRLPVLITISQTTEPVPNTNGLVTRSNLVCVDRRNGRIVYDQPTPETTYSIEVQADPDLKQVELKMSRSTVKLTFTDKPVPE